MGKGKVSAWQDISAFGKKIGDTSKGLEKMTSPGYNLAAYKAGP
jgi:hypothetical protein